ncbi:hypothetical protein GE061_004767 [Apolygus lucorum]|uniref:Uncharacterized protein n=1 Tax=Apolygus lucorum TaxID=248454 RepID=A0A8S9X1X5_APOLU|nr:hypothetical protein GE061_004767 [Apolygus lucorum]
MRNATHVYVRVDTPRTKLAPPYIGPFSILSNDGKTLVYQDDSGANKQISVDRCKPATTHAQIAGSPSTVSSPSSHTLGHFSSATSSYRDEQPNIAQRFKANAVTTASAAASPPLEHHRNGRPTHRPKTDETAASRLIKKTGDYGTIKRVGHQTTPAAPTTNHVHNRGDGSAEAAPTVTLVLNSALQRELHGLLHSWVAHASDIFNHNANTNPDFTSDAAAIHAHPHHGFEGRITEIDISKTAASEITPQVFGYNSSPPPLAQPPPPTQSGLPTPSPPLKIKN